VKYALMARCREEFPVTMMARVLGVSRAGFYEWLTREPSARMQRRVQVGRALEDAFHRYKRRYGAPRLQRALKAQGLRCSENYVAKLMRARRLRAHNGKGYRPGRSAGSLSPAKPNVLDRNFASDRPNCKWVSDITHIRVGRGWAYLAVVLDLYSRKIVGWALDTHMRETLILEALQMALGRREVGPGLLLHSDQGVQYRANEYQQTLQDLGIEASMSRKGNCWDNAVMEAFFARLKVELIYPENHRSIDDLRSALFEYIEIFYNRQRLHSSIGYVDPANFELKSKPVNVSTNCG
jgi:putative transposase